MNRFFRKLSDFDGSDESIAALMALLRAPSELTPWLLQYERRLKQEAASYPIRRAQMRAVNPEYILRNYMAEEAIQAAAEGDFSRVNELLGLLQNPMEEVPGFEAYSQKPPQWAEGIYLTCSS